MNIRDLIAKHLPFVGDKPICILEGKPGYETLIDAKGNVTQTKKEEVKMSQCEMSIEFNFKQILKDISGNVEINFLTPESKPKTISEAMKCSHHILKSIARQIEESSREAKVLAIFARMLGFADGIDEEKELDEVLKEMKAPKELHGILKEFLKHMSKQANAECRKENFEHE